MYHFDPLGLPERLGIEIVAKLWQKEQNFVLTGIGKPFRFSTMDDMTLFICQQDDADSYFERFGVRAT